MKLYAGLRIAKRVGNDGGAGRGADGETRILERTLILCRVTKVYYNIRKERERWRTRELFSHQELADRGACMCRACSWREGSGEV